MNRARLFVVLLTGTLGCASTPAPSDPSEAPSPPSETNPALAEGATVLADNSALQEGLVVFEGTVRPTKGGFDVRGVTLDGVETPD